MRPRRRVARPHAHRYARAGRTAVFRGAHVHARRRAGHRPLRRADERRLHRRSEHTARQRRREPPCPARREPRRALVPRTRLAGAPDRRGRGDLPPHRPAERPSAPVHGGGPLRTLEYHVLCRCRFPSLRWHRLRRVQGRPSGDAPHRREGDHLADGHGHQLAGESQQRQRPAVPVPARDEARRDADEQLLHRRLRGDATAVVEHRTWLDRSFHGRAHVPSRGEHWV